MFLGSRTILIRSGVKNHAKVWYQEFVGGICVALGLLTRVFSIQLVIILAVATFYIHLPNGFLWIKGGYEYPLLWMLIMIAITFRGGGAFSLDSQLPKEF